MLAENQCCVEHYGISSTDCHVSLQSDTIFMHTPVVVVVVVVAAALPAFK